MTARAYWQGQIGLALVSIAVEDYSASNSGATISFNQTHEPCGKRIAYEKVVTGIGLVGRDEIMKGYQSSKSEYVLLENEESEAVKIESRKPLKLVRFVEAHEIDPLYFEKPSYVTSTDELAEQAPKASRSNVIDLMAALYRSLEGKQPSSRKAKSKAQSRRSC